MTDNSRILIINDDENAVAELETVLSFLGEKSISARSNNWFESVGGSDASDSLDLEEKSASSQIAVALIGECSLLSCETLLAELFNWQAELPVILIGVHEFSAAMDDEILARITARLPASLNYQPLLDALHKAKVVQGHFNRQRKFNYVADHTMFRSLVGNSDAIQSVRNMMGHVAHSEVSVLITGESGTGKEVVARNLHLNSSRSDKPFVPINCGAIPRELLESELFGHEKGAFTGAVSSRLGRFELADGGTLFLDEIGDMPLNMQVKLLRVLQEGYFERVGGAETIQTDVRIFAATHKDLEDMIERGEFRQDLYYRINVFPIDMPPLRERQDDVPLLLHELISIMESEKRGSVRFNSAAIAVLSSHDWPGNVRELANLVERMAILHPHGIVGVSDLPEKIRSPKIPGAQPQVDSPEVLQTSERTPEEPYAAVPVGGYPPLQSISNDALLPLKGIDLKEYLANLEKNLIEQALRDCGGVVARAASRLQIRRTTLVEKMRKYSLQKKQADIDPEDHH